MPVFDFNSSPDTEKGSVCTYEIFYSNESQPSAGHPILVLDNSRGELKHHSSGMFTNPVKRTSFEVQTEEGTVSADILQLDARFVSLLKWLGENHINVRLSGADREDGYAVYKIREIAFGGGGKLSGQTKSGEIKCKLVSDDAVDAYKVYEESQKNPIVTYMKKRFITYIAAALAIYLLLSGNMGQIISVVLNLLSGLIETLAGVF